MTHIIKPKILNYVSVPARVKIPCYYSNSNIPRILWFVFYASIITIYHLITMSCLTIPHISFYLKANPLHAICLSSHMYNIKHKFDKNYHSLLFIFTFLLHFFDPIHLSVGHHLWYHFSSHYLLNWNTLPPSHMSHPSQSKFFETMERCLWFLWYNFMYNIMSWNIHRLLVEHTDMYWTCIWLSWWIIHVSYIMLYFKQWLSFQYNKFMKNWRTANFENIALHS